MKRIFLLLLIIFPACLYSQNQFIIDSLQVELKHAKENSSKVRLLWDLASQYKQDNFLKSIEYCDKALSVASKSGDRSMIASAYSRKGAELLLFGDYDKALRNFLEGLTIAEEVNDLKTILRIHNNIGNLYDRLGKYDETLTSYHKALEVYHAMTPEFQLQERHKLSFIYSNIGSLYLAQDDFKTAETYYQKGLEVAIAYDDKTRLGIIYNNLGKVYQFLDDYLKALEYLEKSLKIRQELNDKSEIAKSYYYLTAYYSNIEEYEKAEGMAKIAYDLASEIGSLKLKQGVFFLLFGVYGKSEKFEKALWAYQQYKTVSDSLVNEQTITRMARTQMKYEFEKKEQVRIARQQRIRLINIIIISVFVFSTLIVGLLYVLAKTRGKRVSLEKEKLELDLEVKNKELTTNVMYLVRKNEVINGITTKMLTLKEKVKSTNQGALQEIIIELHSVIDKEVWEEFEYHFQQVHSNFYSELQKRFPVLTPGDKKMAALLRLNMNTKEISSIIGISTNSVEMARYRLRKKMGLANREINLVNFLSDLV